MHDPSFVLDDVMSAAIGEQLRESWSDERDVSEAEWSSVVISSRVLGQVVEISLIGGQFFQGTVTRTFTDALLLDDTTLLSVSAVATCAGVDAEFPLNDEQLPLSSRSQLRDWAGSQISAWLLDGRVMRGELRRVAADHVELVVEGSPLLLRTGAVQAWCLLG